MESCSWESSARGTRRSVGSATSHVMVLVDCYREYWTPTTSLMDGPCESYSSTADPGSTTSNSRGSGTRVRQRRDWWGVRVAPEQGIRFYREGYYPVLRGTRWRIDDRRALLWGGGYKPTLGTYDGSETPRPLMINVQHGEADINQVTCDILALTKLNFNTCRLGDAEPVTVGFSRPSVRFSSPILRFWTDVHSSSSTYRHLVPSCCGAVNQLLKRVLREIPTLRCVEPEV